MGATCQKECKHATVDDASDANSTADENVRRDHSYTSMNSNPIEAWNSAEGQPSSRRRISAFTLITQPEYTVDEIKEYCKEAESFLKYFFRTPPLDRRVLKLAQSERFSPVGGEECLVPMGLCTGPAIPIARRSAIVGWSCLVASSIATFHISQCDVDGYVHYPLVLWFLFIPLVMAQLYWQFQCLKFATLPYLQAAGSFKVFRVFDLGYRIWVMMIIVMSIGQTLDYGTDSFFIAVVLRAGRCENSKVEKIWHEVISQSMLSFLSGFTFGDISLLSYILMFSQPISALLGASPECCDEDHIEYEVDADGTFTNCLCSPKNFGDALFDLADISNMVSIQLMSPVFPRAKATMAWRPAEVDEAMVNRVSSLINNALNRSLMRIGLVTLLENAYQVNLQVSVLGLFLFVAENGSENEQHERFKKLTISTIISVCLGATQACVRVGEVWLTLLFACESIQRFRDAKRDTEDADLRGILSREIAWVVAKASLVILFAFAFLLSIGYAVVKFYFLLVVCEDRLWNLSGCVDMTRFKTNSTVA